MGTKRITVLKNSKNLDLCTKSDNSLEKILPKEEQKRQ
jgi:hypothetical protein